MLEDVKAADEDHILALEEEFRELTMKEADLYEQLVQVRTTKHGIRRLVAEKKNRYAPIFVLPDELLVAIVEAAQQPTGAPVEVIASQISQRFRWAVLGTSYLWSSIELRWGGRSDAERLAAYLERSRTCTVSVRLKYDSYHGEEECDYEEVPNELDTVAQHISRIRRLVVHCGGTGLHLLDVVSHLGGLHAPLLEYVDIFSRASDLDNWDEPALFFNGGAPHLTTLKLTNVDIDPGNPWISSITSLDLRGMQFPDISILYHCPQLTDATLDDSTFFINAENTIFTPFLRSLRGLCLNPRWPHSLTGGVLGSLHAPALEILEFSGVHGGSQISSFFNYYPSKFPALKSLTFANSDIQCRGCHDLQPEGIQPETLRAFSALTCLTIVNVCYLPRILEDLLAMSAGTAGDGSPCSALPAMHTLTLRYKDFDEFGVSNWPPLAAVPFMAEDPMLALRNRLASLRTLRPIHLRLPRSRFFTDAGDWARDDPNFEILDVGPLLQALGHDDENTGVTDLVD